MNLSKSKYCSGIGCNKKLWMMTYMPEVAVEVDNESVFETGHEVGELAKGLFGEYYDIPFNEKLSEMINDTRKAINSGYKVITEASFVYNNNFCSVDILKCNNNEVEIYEVKSSTEVKDIYLDDISYQVYVLINLGYKVNRACVVTINGNYERYGELELDKLFDINDVTEMAFDKQEEVENNIKKINLYMEQSNEPDMGLGMYCMKPYTCPFFNYCSRNLDSNNVFNIRGMTNSSKFKFYDKGITSYSDLLEEGINDKYRQQIEFTLYDKEDYINTGNIKKFMKDLYYPMYFLDFETFQQAIPRYDGIRPYMQIPFQYSLHCIEKEDGLLEHKEYLARADIDPRRELAESLVRDIPVNGCVVAYNMKFEKMVIKQLASLYSDLREHLMNIHDNMYDLMIPFKDRDYYTKEMAGSYSIKYVLPALFPNDPSLDYHNLELIHNGSEAMDSYANLGSKSLEEQELIRKSLLKYCELDTYAMVKIYYRLKDLCNENTDRD